MREKLDHIAKIVEENNQLLRFLIKNINKDDLDDFGRNIFANLISNSIYK